METAALENIGLTKREIKVYLALLELGSTTVGPLEHKASVPSSKIYEILKKLIEKGLVSYVIVRGRKNFQASDPKKIIAIMEQRKSEIQKLIPFLESKQLMVKEKRYVEMFVGIKAMKSMMVHILSDAKKTEDWYGFSTLLTSLDDRTKRFYIWQGGFRDKKTRDHLLISKKNKHIFEQRYLESLEYMRKKGTIKYTKFPLPGDTAVFRDMIIVFNWDEMPTTILIQNKVLAKQYKDFFEELWAESEEP
jgi:sugar-specific transcriptional regulator TrmB